MKRFIAGDGRHRVAPPPGGLDADRKDDGSAIQVVCAQVVVLCRRLDMFSKAVVAIDGSKF